MECPLSGSVFVFSTAAPRGSSCGAGCLNDILADTEQKVFVVREHTVPNIKLLGGVGGRRMGWEGTIYLAIFILIT